MAMPTAIEITLPLLDAIRDGREYKLRSVVNIIIEHFELTDEERQIRESNRQPKILNRTNWASTHLAKACLIQRPQKGSVAITSEGRALLDRKPDKITRKLLREFPSYANWQAELRKNALSRRADDKKKAEGSIEQSQELGPVEIMDFNAAILRKQLAEELIEIIQRKSSDSFESLVLDLMQAMGYGRLGAGRVTGGSGDGGIDGIIDEDKLGLEKIYLQAKRYAPDRSIGSKDIQAFKGSLDDHNANKGVFITTSRFSPNAKRSAGSSSQYRIVLIDGQRLAELMIDYDVGVNTQTSWILKRVDSEYFDLEM